MADLEYLEVCKVHGSIFEVAWSTSVTVMMPAISKSAYIHRNRGKGL